MYSDNDIVIVSKSCVLPGAINFTEFENAILAEKSFITEISDSRWDKKINYSPYKEVDDKSYSHWGAEIQESIYSELANKWSINSKNKLEIMTTEALNQSIQHIKLPANRKKIGLILGAMNPDENFYITKFKKQLNPLLTEIEESYTKKEFETIKLYLDNHCRFLFKNIDENIDDILPQSILHKSCLRFDIQGPHFIVDAACAAALASIDTATALIKSDVIEFAFVGGIESNLGQGSYVLFSKVGALAPNQTLPFDKKSQGLSQGEGAVIFGIQKRSAAIQMGNTILATICNIGSSSDGKVASLFQPDKNGQLLALKRAYHFTKTKNIDFLEMHGTGTQIGDLTEASSATEFFENFHIPAGSVKYNIGHTKATAGAASILKCLVIAKNKLIPASTYCTDSIVPQDGSVFINNKKIEISKTENFRFGISSFGFGGTNFHLVLDVATNNEKTISIKENKQSKQKQKAVLLKQKTIQWDDFKTEDFISKNSFYKLPPFSIPYIDKAQLLAVMGLHQLLNLDLKLQLNQNIKDQVQVISASSIGLDILDDIVARVSLDTIGETINQEKIHTELAEKIFNLKKRFQKVNEESGPGILNNVIAGRVSNAFHFRGRNMNIDCDQGSIGAAMLTAAATIENGQSPLIVLIAIHENVDAKNLKIERTGITIYLLSSKEFAKNNFLHIEQDIKVNTDAI